MKSLSTKLKICRKVMVAFYLSTFNCLYLVPQYMTIINQINSRRSSSHPLSREVQKHREVEKIQIYPRRKHKHRRITKRCLQKNTEQIMKVMKRGEFSIILKAAQQAVETLMIQNKIQKQRPRLRH